MWETFKKQIQKARAERARGRAIKSVLEKGAGSPRKDLGTVLQLLGSQGETDLYKLAEEIPPRLLTTEVVTYLAQNNFQAVRALMYSGNLEAESWQLVRDLLLVELGKLLRGGGGYEFHDVEKWQNALILFPLKAGAISSKQRERAVADLQKAKTTLKTLGFFVRWRNKLARAPGKVIELGMERELVDWKKGKRMAETNKKFARVQYARRAMGIVLLTQPELDSEILEFAKEAASWGDDKVWEIHYVRQSAADEALIMSLALNKRIGAGLALALIEKENFWTEERIEKVYEFMSKPSEVKKQHPADSMFRAGRTLPYELMWFHGTDTQQAFRGLKGLLNLDESAALDAIKERPNRLKEFTADQIKILLASGSKNIRVQAIMTLGDKAKGTAMREEAGWESRSETDIGGLNISKSRQASKPIDGVRKR